MNIIIIPARMDSKRYPGKPLEEAKGKPLLKWTYEAARKVKSANMVVVATSDKEIADACLDLGMNFSRVDDKGIRTGTQRCARAIRSLPEIVKPSSAERISIATAARIVVNWQVDEPMVDPTDVDFMIRLMQNRIANGIKTLCVKPHAADLEDSVNHNPNVVKVVVINGKCHWFSRAPMANSLFHIGVYGFGSTKLAGLECAEETEYSKSEGLEQLAWIEKGHIIRPVVVNKTPLSINTKEDMFIFRRLVENEDARRPD